MTAFTITSQGNAIVPNRACPCTFGVTFANSQPVFSSATLGFKVFPGDAVTVLSDTITAAFATAGQIQHTGGIVDATWTPAALFANSIGLWGAEFYFVLTAAQTNLFLAYAGSGVDLYLDGQISGVADPVSVLIASVPVASGGVSG